MNNGRVYLDFASAAPVSGAAREAFSNALKTFGNPSSPHAEGEAARLLVESARQRIATLAGTRPESVIFTSGATEANNLAIQGHIRALLDSSKDASDLHVLYLPTAHASIVETVEALQKIGVVTEPMVFTNGALDLQILRTQIRPETVLVCTDVVCGETGTWYKTRDIRRVLDAVRLDRARDTDANHQNSVSRITLHVDASQAPLIESFEHTHLGADLITLDAQKVGGVRGVGALLRPRTNIPIAPIMYGGGQEEGVRPGTENPVLATAFAAALEEAHKGREEFTTRARSARARLITQITADIPSIELNGGKECAPHILNISLLGRDTDYLVMLLSEAGFAVSTKSACETNEEGSRVVLAMTRDSARADSTLRISWGPTTSDDELAHFTKELIRSVAFLDTH